MVAIGPALETFLGVLLLGVLILGGLALFTRPLWPRITRYFRVWYERDMRAEEQRKAEVESRKKAEEELEIWQSQPPEGATKAATLSPEQHNEMSEPAQGVQVGKGKNQDEANPS